MADVNEEEPAEGAGARTVAPGQMEAPGGCGCGVGGCLTVLVVISALLLGTLILMALTRAWPRGLQPF